MPAATTLDQDKGSAAPLLRFRSVYVAARSALLLVSDKFHSLNYDGAALPGSRVIPPQPLLPLADSLLAGAFF